MTILDKTARKTIVPSSLDTEGWREVPLAYRERAFFSATVENAHFLQRAKNLITRYQTNERDPEHGGMTSQGRTQFVNELKEFCYQEGMGRADEKGNLLPLNNNDLRDIRSTKRLQLIFDTQVEQANAYEDWKNGQDDTLLQWFPAQRFIRVRSSKNPRPLHSANEGVVRLKNDTKFWISMNPDFGVPWGPWGFNSGMGVEDVDRTEALALGLIQPNDILEPDVKNFNDNLAASVDDLNDDTQNWLLDTLAGQAKIIGKQLFFSPLKNTADELISDYPEYPYGDYSPKQSTPATPDELERIDKKMQALLTTDDMSITKKQRAALKKRALALISLPKSQRGKLNLSRSPLLFGAKNIEEAKNTLTRLVSPSLLPPKIKTIHLRSDREYADEAGIHVKRSTSSSVVLHEMMHQVENNSPKTLKKSAEFLFSRAKIINGQIEVPQPLSLLTGHNYDPCEYAIKDDFASRGGTSYMGKLYMDGILTHDGKSAVWNQKRYDSMSLDKRKKAIESTELLSSGIERLVKDPLKFYRQDPEYFTFIIKTIRNK